MKNIEKVAFLVEPYFFNTLNELKIKKKLKTSANFVFLIHVYLPFFRYFEISIKQLK